MLPFNLAPALSTYLYTAYPFGMAERRIPSAMLNWNIQLMFRPGKIGPYQQALAVYPALNLRAYARFGLFDLRMHLAGRASAAALAAVGDLAKANLARGRYLWLFGDYFYIPGTTHFSKTHFRHDLLIFGHEDGRGLFHGALYRENGTFGEVQFTAEQLHDAVASPEARGADCAAYCRNDLLASVAPNLEAMQVNELDVAGIQAQVESYLTSSPVFKIQHRGTASAVEDISFGAPEELNRASFGKNVYKTIGGHFSRHLKWGNLRYDLRITHLLYEHKRLMGLRLQRMVECGWPRLGDAPRAWAEVEQQAKLIHLRAVAARQRADIAPLKSIQEELQKLEQSETDLLKRVLTSRTGKPRRQASGANGRQRAGDLP